MNINNNIIDHVTMRNGDYLRVLIKSTDKMKEAILNAYIQEFNLNKEKITLQDINNSGYGSVDFVEVEIENNSLNLVYFFNEYRILNYTFSQEEKDFFIDFHDKNIDKYLDNSDMFLGDAEWYDKAYELLDTIEPEL